MRLIFYIKVLTPKEALYCICIKRDRKMETVALEPEDDIKSKSVNIKKKSVLLNHSKGTQST